MQSNEGIEGMVETEGTEGTEGNTVSVSQEFETIDYMIAVKGIPLPVTEKVIKKLFSMYGSIRKVNIRQISDQKAVTYITYDTTRAADNAIKYLNGNVVFKSTLYLSKAKRKLKRSDHLLNGQQNQCLDFGDNGLQTHTTVADTCNQTQSQMIGINIETNDKLCDQLSQCQTNGMSSEGSDEQRLSSLKKRQSIYALNELSFDTQSSEEMVDIREIINRLSKDLLQKIFNHLILEELFVFKGVCRLWRTIINQMIGTYISVSIGNKAGICCSDQKHCFKESNDITIPLTDSKGKVVLDNWNKLVPIMRSLEAVECLHLTNCFITSLNFKCILSQFPNLKCLRLDSIEGIGRLDWPKLGRPLSKKLIHFSFAGNTLNVWQSLPTMVTSFIALEELVISDYDQDLTPVFKNLSTTLKKLSLNGCKQLSSQAVNCLIRRKQLNIEFIEIDFKVNSLSVPNIQSFHNISDNLLSFKALNVKNENFIEFNHNIDAKSLSIVYKDFVDFYNLFISVAIKRGLVSLQITASIRPSDMKNFSKRFPDCNRLVMKDCFLVCECRVGRNGIIESDCNKCLSQLNANIFQETSLSFVSINGEEFERI